jgi:hypothetical protein
LAGTGVPPLLAKSENIYQRKIHTNKKNIPGVSSFWQAPVCHDCSLKRKSYKIHTNKKIPGVSSIWQAPVCRHCSLACEAFS